MGSRCCKRAASHNNDQFNQELTIADAEGNSYYSDDDFEQAIQCYLQELNIAKEAGDRAGEGRAYANLGKACYSHDDFKQAIQYHSQERDIAKETGDRAGEGRAYGNLGNAYRSLGEFKEAIECHKQQRKIAEAMGDTEGQIDAYGNLGSDYHCLGDFEEAIHHHRTELKKAEDAGDEARLGKANSHLGTDHYSFKRFTKGLECHRIHLNIAKKMKDENGKGLAYGNIGIGYRKIGKFNEAKGCHKEELRIAKEAKDEAAKANACLNLGSAYRGLFRYYYARWYHWKGLRIAEQLSEKVVQGDALYKLGRDFECSGSPIKAVKKYRSSVKIYNDVRCSLKKEDNWKISFRDSHQKAYTALWRTLLKLHKYHEALYVAEQGRAQALVDLLHLQHGVKDECDADTEGTIRSYISSEIKTQTVFFALESNKIHYWVFGRGKQLQFRQKEINISTVLQRSLENAHDQARARSNDINSLRNLYDLIIEPIKDSLQDGELIIVPDGQLFLVPFNALHPAGTKEEYLFEFFRIRIVPSLTTLKLISDSPECEGGALLVGDPHHSNTRLLPHAKEEVKRIEKLLHQKTQNVTTLVEEQATKQKVLEQINSAALLHIAAHGKVDGGEIDLAGNDVLTMADLQGVKLKARLAVLSCCDTGQGKVTSDGVVGIARAFLGAGARSVLVTLWAVDDKASMSFMEKFYEQLVDGKSATVALQQTLNDFKSRSEHRHLFFRSNNFSAVKYWAPFVLIGDDVAFRFGETEHGK